MEALGMTALAPSWSFWRGRRVLLTGHTGFKGGWLTIWLHALGAKVTGISLAPTTAPSLFHDARIEDLCQSHICDIRDAKALCSLLTKGAPDVVFHLAAQPLVRESYREPVTTFATNVMGTVHVLDALRAVSSVRVAVMVTTDKVYENRGSHRPYDEEDPLGGHDPYSGSKAAAELAIACYRRAFLDAQGTAVVSARAGNVIGGGDWSGDRLIPDAIRAWQEGRPLEVRSPGSVRPWQHVLDPLAGYLALAHALWDGRAAVGAYNFGPDAEDACTVREVVDRARAAYGEGDVRFAQILPDVHEAALLTLNTAKTRRVLGLAPRFALSAAIDRTMAWYRAYRAGGDARSLCLADIAAFTGAA